MVGSCTANTMILPSCMAISACSVNLVRKHAFSVQVGINGDIGLAHGHIDSMPPQGSNLVRSMGVDASGNIEVEADGRDKATALFRSVEMGGSGSSAEQPWPTIVRKTYSQNATHSISISPQVTELKTPPENDTVVVRKTKLLDTTHSHSRSFLADELPLSSDSDAVIVRKTKAQDATRSNSMSTSADELTQSMETDTAVSKIATLLRERVGHYRDVDHSRTIGIGMCIFSMMAGCLAAAVFTRAEYRNDVAKPANEHARADSDGESGSSTSSKDDEDDHELVYDIRSSCKSIVVRPGQRAAQAEALAKNSLEGTFPEKQLGTPEESDTFMRSSFMVDADDLAIQRGIPFGLREPEKDRAEIDTPASVA